MLNRLRPYQSQVGKAILDSVLGRKGLTFSVEISRQGGKNELSAQLEVLLLTLFLGLGGNAVKCAPSFKPQTVVSMLRLKERLNDVGLAGFWTPEHGYMVCLGKAHQLFFSADKSSNVVGATAHILLEIDEAQDVSPEKYDKEFRPMGSSTNVTSVLYGTAWDDASLLERVKQANLEQERLDGIKRHFSFDWQEVAKYNPDYLHYVEAERARAYLLDLLQGGGVKLHVDYIDLLYRTLHDLCEAPRTSFGDNRQGLSGVALEMELHPLLQKVRRKRLIRSTVYRRRNEMILRLLELKTKQSFGRPRSRIIWGPVLPQDRSRLVHDEQVLVSAGIHSRRRAMDELGVEDADAEYQRWLEEEQMAGKVLHPHPEGGGIKT